MIFFLRERSLRTCLSWLHCSCRPWRLMSLLISTKKMWFSQRFDHFNSRLRPCPKPFKRNTALQKDWFTESREAPLSKWNSLIRGTKKMNSAMHWMPKIPDCCIQFFLSLAPLANGANHIAFCRLIHCIKIWCDCTATCRCPPFLVVPRGLWPAHMKQTRLLVDHPWTLRSGTWLEKSSAFLHGLNLFVTRRSIW